MSAASNITKWGRLVSLLMMVASGVALGIPAALASTRLISTLLFGLTASDPTTIALATLILLGVAAFAGYLPARRAPRIDPTHSAASDRSLSYRLPERKIDKHVTWLKCGNRRRRVWYSATG